MIGEGKTRGQTAILKTSAATKQNVAAILCSYTQIPSEYLFLWLLERYSETRSRGSGGMQQALNAGLVGTLPIPLAPLMEQFQMVRFLNGCFSTIDNIQNLTEKTIDDLNRLRRTILRKAFEGKLVPQDPNNEPAKILNSFIIIEYKREKNFSVIDQGYAYLALLLNNKAEFILVYNENSKSMLRKHDVDWTQSRVIFISPFFTAYQRKAIEFKDLPIELWEVKLYANNIVLFNQIQSPEKSESITKLSQKSELVRSVSKEVIVYNEENHFKDSNSQIRELYQELKEAILSIAADITVKPKARHIAFIHKTNFVDIVVRKSNLTLFLNMNKGTLNDPKSLTRDVSNVGHWGNGDYEIVVKDTADMGYLLSLIRQSYENN